MNKKEAEKLFKENVMPSIREAFERDGKRDLPARREAWNNFTDSLCKDGEISLKQYESWLHPAICL